MIAQFICSPCMSYGPVTELLVIISVCTAWAISGIALAAAADSTRTPSPLMVITSMMVGPGMLAYNYYRRAYPFKEKFQPETTTVQDVRKIQQIFKAQGIEQADGPYSAWKPREGNKEDDGGSEKGG